MVSVLATSALGNNPLVRAPVCYAKAYESGICYLSAKHAVLRLLVGSEWEQCVCMEQNLYPLIIILVSFRHKIPTKRVGLVSSGPHYYLIEK
jgi:hypothetical protein